MTEKYSIGDIVEVTRPGSGVGSWDIRKLAKITALGDYTYWPGYKIIPKLGNCLSGEFGGFIGEASFKRTLRAVIFQAMHGSKLPGDLSKDGTD